MRKITSARELEELSKDGGIFTIHPAYGIEAVTEEEVVSAFSLAFAEGMSLTPRGAGTSIPSQGVGAGSVLLQKRNQKLMGQSSVGCSPDVVKADLNAFLNSSGRWMPVDPSSYRSCTVGGMVANNSAGARTLKYGSTADHLLSCRVLLPEEGLRTAGSVKIEDAFAGEGSTRRVAELLVENANEVAAERPKVTKNSCGYRLEKVVHDGLLDLPKLFAGSEGTLGVFTWLELATTVRPALRALLIVETNLAEVGSVSSALRSHRPSALELVDKSVFAATGREALLRPYTKTSEGLLVFCELEASDQVQLEERELELSSDSRVSQLETLLLADGSAVQNAWDARNETLTLASELRHNSRVLLPGIEDLVVPPEKLDDLIRFLVGELEGKGLDYISYGHAGDANLHVRPFLDPTSPREMRVLHELMEECFEYTWKIGGSISGEHGDGRLRAPYVERQYPKTYQLMRQVKDTYDPKGIMNPGVKLA